MAVYFLRLLQDSQAGRISQGYSLTEAACERVVDGGVKMWEVPKDLPDACPDAVSTFAHGGTSYQDPANQDPLSQHSENTALVN